MDVHVEKASKWTAVQVAENKVAKKEEAAPRPQKVLWDQINNFFLHKHRSECRPGKQRAHYDKNKLIIRSTSF